MLYKLTACNFLCWMLWKLTACNTSCCMLLYLIYNRYVAVMASNNLKSSPTPSHPHSQIPLKHTKTETLSWFSLSFQKKSDFWLKISLPETSDVTSISYQGLVSLQGPSKFAVGIWLQSLSSCKLQHITSSWMKDISATDLSAWMRCNVHG